MIRADIAGLRRGNLFAPVKKSEDEFVEVLMSGKSGGTRVERIISHGHVSPAGFWYDQDEWEFVAVLRVADNGKSFASVSVAAAFVRHVDNAAAQVANTFNSDSANAALRAVEFRSCRVRRAQSEAVELRNRNDLSTERT